MSTKKYRVFLSHNSKDKPEVEVIAKQLRQDEEIEVWLDIWNLLAGDIWMEEIEKALEECNVFVFFVGNNGNGPWQHEEMTLAIDRRVTAQEGIYRVIPVLLPKANRGDRSKLSKYLVRSTWVEFRESLDEKDTLAYLIRSIKGERNAAVTADSSICPFKGLSYFDVEDSPYYFGREALTEWLINDLKANNFLAIIGASGSGKSSLARAGLLAALKKDKLPNSTRWTQVVLFPGVNPLENLAVALAGEDIIPNSPSEIKSFIQGASTEQDYLHLATRSYISRFPERDKVIVLIDQFEEVFTHCKDENIRKGFIDNLCYAVTANEGKAIILLTMRSDFFGKCAPYPRLSALLSSWSPLVSPMSKEEVRAAIQEPAIYYEFQYEAGLVDQLVQASLAEPTSLPLLQDCLSELWNKKQANIISYKDYDELGGIAGGLDKRATTFYEQLSKEDQKLCKTILLRLTQPGEGTEDTKRRVKIEELTKLPFETTRIEQLLKELTSPENRLLTADKDEIEITHEALIRNWNLLKAWIEEERENLNIHRRLSREVKEWIASEKQKDYLYNGVKLAQIEEWIKDQDIFLNEEEQEFYDTSIVQRKQKEKRRKTIFFSVVGAILVFIGGLSYALFSVNQAKKETDKKQGLVLSSFAREINEASSIIYRLAEEAYFLNPEDVSIQNTYLGAKENLIPYTRLEGHKNLVLGAVFSKDEQKVLSWSTDHTLRVWNSDGLGEPTVLAGHKNQVLGAVFSKDEQKVLSWSSDHTLRIWNSDGSGEPIILKGHEDIVWKAVFSKDEQKVLSWSDDRTLRIWNSDGSGEPTILKGHEGEVLGAIFNKDEQRILSWSADHTLRIWQSDGSGSPIVLVGHEDVVWGAIFSKDEQKVLSWSADHTLRIWQSDGSGSPIVLVGHEDEVWGAIFSKDEQKVLSWSGGFYSEDHTLRIWNSSGSGEPIILGDHEDGVLGGIFSKDEQKVLSWSADHTLHIWNLVELGDPIALVGHKDIVLGAVFSQNEQKVLSWSADNTLHIWDSDGLVKPIILEGHEDVVWGAIFSKDEQKVLSWSADHTLRIWDLNIDRILKNLYKQYPDEMYQPLSKEIKRKYGLQGLYMERMKDVVGK